MGQTDYAMDRARDMGEDMVASQRFPVVVQLGFWPQALLRAARDDVAFLVERIAAFPGSGACTTIRLIVGSEGFRTDHKRRIKGCVDRCRELRYSRRVKSCKSPIITRTTARHG
jgi:hypothetical protein